VFPEGEDRRPGHGRDRARQRRGDDEAIDKLDILRKQRRSFAQRAQARRPRTATA
jgi:hypothetical protein